MPVSDENDMSLPLAEILTTVRSEYFVSSIFRKLCHANPEAADNGNTREVAPEI